MASRTTKATTMCGAGIHRMTRENRTATGRCKQCATKRKRQERGRSNGQPRCWTGEHIAPAPGTLCACGEQAPPPGWLDWAAVERALDGRDPGRPLTAREKVCAIDTVIARGLNREDADERPRDELYEVPAIPGGIDRVTQAARWLRRHAPYAGIPENPWKHLLRETSPERITATQAFVRTVAEATDLGDV